MERDRDESIFRQVWYDCLRSLFFFGSLLLGIILLGSLSRWLGLALFTIFALVTLKDILRLLMAVGLGVLVLPFTIMAALKIAPISGQKGFGNEFHILNANAVVLMQLFVLIGYNLFLYSHFFMTNNPVFP